MKRKSILIIIGAIILDAAIFLFGQSPFPNIFQGGYYSLNISNIIWCILFDLLLLFFGLNASRIFDLPYEALMNRQLVWNLSKNDFKVRYVGSYLGIFWAFINPLVTILLYWLVFQFAFKAGDVDGYPFVLWLVSGLVPWFLVQDAIVNGTNALIEYVYLVKKVLFQVSVLPAIKIISAALVHIMFMLVAMVIFTCVGYYPSPLYLLQLLYYFGCTIVFTLSIVYVTSSVVLFVRDLGQFINVFMQVFMWASPIMWRIDIVPDKIRWVFKLNPAYYIISGYRDSLLYHISLFQHIGHTLYFWWVVILLLIVGSDIFTKLKPHFADVL